MTLVQDVFHSCISKWNSKKKLINILKTRAEQRIHQIARKNCRLHRTLDHKAVAVDSIQKHSEHSASPLSNVYKA